MTKSSVIKVLSAAYTLLFTSSSTWPYVTSKGTTFAMQIATFVVQCCILLRVIKSFGYQRHQQVDATCDPKLNFLNFNMQHLLYNFARCCCQVIWFLTALIKWVQRLAQSSTFRKATYNVCCTSLHAFFLVIGLSAAQ